MNLSTQKRIAAEIMKCGVSRIRIKEDKDVEEALTREDIRNLIKKGLIKRIQKKGTSRVHARAILRQKKRNLGFAGHTTSTHSSSMQVAPVS